MSSQYLISTRWMSRRGLLRSLGRCFLPGVGGSAGGWRCCWGAASQTPSAAPTTPKNPPPCSILLFRVFAEIGVTSTISGRVEVNLSLSEKWGGKSKLKHVYFQLIQKSGDFAWSSVRCCLYISMETTLDPKEPVLLIALKITRHAKLCGDHVPYLRML